MKTVILFLMLVSNTQAADVTVGDFEFARDALVQGKCDNDRTNRVADQERVTSEAGAVSINPRPHLIAAAAFHCQEIFDSLVGKATVDEVANAMVDSESSGVHMTSIREQLEQMSPRIATAAEYTKTVLAFKSAYVKVHAACAADKDEGICQAKAEFWETAQDAESSVTERTTPVTKAVLVGRFCEALGREQGAMSHLNEEKERAKLSGVANVRKLRIYGDEAFSAGKIVKAMQTDGYKASDCGRSPAAN